MSDMERKIARFNERITIQKNTVVTDRIGNHTNAWADWFSCFAYASTYQYDKEEAAATTRQEQTINFEVRYCTELKDLDSTHYRVSFHGQPYDIESVDMMNYQRKTIRIVCKLDTTVKKGAKP